MENAKQILLDLPKEKEFFIGFDSDGCVFDSMEIKHKECFCPNTIKYWNLQRVAKYAREVWDFVNLYSSTRGYNRFLALIRAHELLAQRDEVKMRDAKLKDLTPLIEWTNNETKLGNPALEKLVKTNPDPILKTALEWSYGINAFVKDIVYDIPPFPYVQDILEKIQERVDVIVVSQTPLEALEREWKENNIDPYAKIICGQEFGTKTEHLKYAAKGKYDDDKILMIGDAPGDYKAAQKNNVLFYPINPGHEEASWERFYHEALDIFFAGEFAGDYETRLIEEFNSYLPEKPPWE